MKNQRKKILSMIAVSLLFVWVGLFLTQKIDLTTADIGRHLENGKIIFHSSFSDIWRLLRNNFYSYTNGSFSFINHHWGSGAVFYLVFAAVGFSGLSVVYLILYLTAFGFFFADAKKRSGLLLALVSALVLIPLAVGRSEIRPEVFTYLFLGVFWWLLNRYREGKMSARQLWLLPVLELLWVNLHIGFVMGEFLAGIFLLERIIVCGRKNDWRSCRGLFFIFVGVCLATLANPSGLSGALYPLNIFNNYGYMIVENQSVIFLERMHHTAGLHLVYFQAVLAVLALSFIMVFIRRRKDFFWVNFFVSGILGVLAFMQVRSFPLFALVCLPVLADNLKILLPKEISETKTIIIGSFAGLVLISCFFYEANDVWQRRDSFGLGLLPRVEGSADFFLTHNIQGPIFNNYDIGGYLIYYLYPRYKVFVDNRPEAYPADFFQKIYIPAQENEDDFTKLNEQYNFNAIFFSYRDLTPWGQEFLVRIVKDLDWAPVYVDQYNIILLKRNAANAELIKKYELPSSYFSVVSAQ
jgi:hypothetical protein